VNEERARLFVALELPAEVRSALLAWRPGLPGLRLLPEASLHVTLCFLGWVPVGAVGAVACACEPASALPAPALGLGEPVWLPRRRPRVLAVSVLDESGALRAVQSWLSGALAAGGWYEPERRPWLAHVTIARASADARLGHVQLDPPEAIQFAGDAIVLYRSRLSRGGAAYEPLSRVSLIGSPSQ
jgi:2'-5' RNA ligase